MFRIIINKALSNSTATVATIGNFDGLHLGHRQLFNQLNQVAIKCNYRRLAITFEPLPLEFFLDCKHQQRLHRLCLLRDKFYLFKTENLIDELVVLHFNSSIANLAPNQFIQNILKDKLNIQHVVVGHDFKFGKGGVGNIKDFSQNGISHSIIGPFMLNNERISSSIIREIAANNELDKVKLYLGRNLHYTARIIHGNKMGRKFGVPTINLTLGRNRPVVHGIYIANVYIENVRYNAVASIGKNPTTNALDVYKLEAHLLDVDLDLYGKIATVEILKFIREERKYDDLDSLFRQIHQDITDTRNYFMEY
jgi:riboflavin kinase/FMN adenylyltransferase